MQWSKAQSLAMTATILQDMNLHRLVFVYILLATSDLQTLQAVANSRTVIKRETELAVVGIRHCLL